MTDSSKPRSKPRRRRRRRRGGSRNTGNAPRKLPIHKRVSSHFQKGDRQRGSEYYRDGRVELNVEGNRATARVAGTEQEAYGVGLDWSQAQSRKELHVFCECRRFADGQPCKHLWATLLSISGTAANRQPQGTDQLSLRRDHKNRWKDLPATVKGKGDGGKGKAQGKQQQKPPQGKRQQRSRGRGRGRKHDPNSWRSRLESVREEVERLAESEAERNRPPATDVEARFLLNTSASHGAGGLVFDLFEGLGDSGGDTEKLRPLTVEPDLLEALLLTAAAPSGAAAGDGDGDGDGGERDHGDEDGGEAEAGAEAVPASLVAALPAAPRGRQRRGRQGQGKGRSKGRSVREKPPKVGRLVLPSALHDTVLPHLCQAGVVSWWDGRSGPEMKPLAWDDGAPWHLALHMELAADGTARLQGMLERGDESRPLEELVATLPVDWTTPGGPSKRKGQRADAYPTLVLFERTLARLADDEPGRDLPWLGLLRGTPNGFPIPKQDLEEALGELLEMPAAPRIATPEDLPLDEVRSPMRPCLVLESDPAPEWMDPPLLAELSFFYGPLKVSAGDPRPAIVDWGQRTFLRRDMEAEHKALVRLLELGLHPVSSEEGHGLQLGHDELPSVAEPLLAEGWTVEVHGASLRSASPPKLKVESGVDWFELSGAMDFSGQPLELPAALAAIKRGDPFIELEDGTRGLLPSSWVEAYGSLSQLAYESTDEGLRFLPSQALLVDALLAASPPAVDRPFAQLREKLGSLERIKPKKELKSFAGTLRAYQRQGLGWLDFLREFGLGGVLADDMGLGKTVQVLALINAYRTPAKTTGLPFLVVAPRSLVYNWIDEARRFTPKLEVLEYAGADREALRDKLSDFDLVVTTYGTLRRDIGYLATVEFDTVILDEAQAIKNRDSQSAKASRLLVGRHRLALTGTPIENHLGELGSIFEFLNPGLFGRLPRLDVLVTGRTPSEKELEMVAQGMRPFILRRTKAEVLPDLPPKTEQTLHCTLRPEQRDLYDRLRQHYRSSLLERVESEGMAGSSIQVLEALLRLRQVACHPGLVDAEWNEAGSAKLEALFSQVDEVLEEGHKVVVFSQFTKLLAYVRDELDAQDIAYAYLDGQTKNRGDVVERFQTDPDCNLFLISIKAGGVGLNLTAAGYVFLLDPWWNPAVEAQAIDRVHRIGQDQPVFAYRLIARDTVEEKILELQGSKRKLADAILEADGRPLSELTADDLRILLS